MKTIWDMRNPNRRPGDGRKRTPQKRAGKILSGISTAHLVGIDVRSNRVTTLPLIHGGEDIGMGVVNTLAV